MEDLGRADIEGYVVSGWSALERGDLQGARAALQDLYSADPTHPELPLLAAGIRRVRPRPVPWRAAVLLIVVVVAGIVGVTAWTRHNRVTPTPRHPSTTANAETSLQRTVPATTDAERDGNGRASVIPASPTPKQNPTPTIDEDVIVRQAIHRFEVAYRSREGELAFEHCDVSRDVSQATAVCRRRPAPDTPDAQPGGLWTFSLRKAEGAWRIASVQLP
jgi:hypothetical protein